MRGCIKGSLWLSLSALLALFLSACAGAPVVAGEEGSKLRVVATTGPIGDAVRAVAGDAVALRVLLGPGIDPHTYVATESDIRAFQRADVIFYNGLHLEAQLERVLRQLGQRGVATVVAIGETLPAEKLLGWEAETGKTHDPHIWHDAQLWKEAVRTIRDTLIVADPAHAEGYRANASAYLAQLDALDAYIRDRAATLPPERRILVTAHDAFGYFGRAYGFEVEAIQGISSATEASAADIQALTSLVLERNVPAIFVETTIAPRTIEAVRAAVRAAGREVTLGGELYSDALGAPDGPTGTYLGMMRHNIDTIVAALGARAASPRTTVTDLAEKAGPYPILPYMARYVPVLEGRGEVATLRTPPLLPAAGARPVERRTGPLPRAAYDGSRRAVPSRHLPIAEV
ncbi:MAG: zinc ABC transporter substrate-binding protein [Chloroflexaceae bacterium]|nr:zinc ABC transporter substrate-binding protein [Chloroflexaceae bacterium]